MTLYRIPVPGPLSKGFRGTGSGTDPVPLFSKGFWGHVPDSGTDPVPGPLSKGFWGTGSGTNPVHVPLIFKGIWGYRIRTYFQTDFGVTVVDSG